MSTNETRFNVIEFMNSRQAKHKYTEEQREEVRQLVEVAICECLKTLNPNTAPFFSNGELMPWGLPGDDDGR